MPRRGNANDIVTATQADRNFSRVARIAEKKGRVVIFKNNRPRLLFKGIEYDTAHEAVNNRIGVRHGTEQTQKTA